MRYTMLRPGDDPTAQPHAPIRPNLGGIVVVGLVMAISGALCLFLALPKAQSKQPEPTEPTGTSAPIPTAPGYTLSNATTSTPTGSPTATISYTDTPVATPTPWVIEITMIVTQLVTKEKIVKVEVPIETTRVITQQVPYPVEVTRQVPIYLTQIVYVPVTVTPSTTPTPTNTPTPTATPTNTPTPTATETTTP